MTATPDRIRGDTSVPRASVFPVAMFVTRVTRHRCCRRHDVVILSQDRDGAGVQGKLHVRREPMGEALLRRPALQAVRGLLPRQRVLRGTGADGGTGRRVQQQPVRVLRDQHVGGREARADDRPVSAGRVDGTGRAGQVRERRPRQPGDRVPGDRRRHGAHVPERVLRVVPRRAAARDVLETGVPVLGRGRGRRAAVRARRERVRRRHAVPRGPVVLRGLPEPHAAAVRAGAAAAGAGRAAAAVSPGPGGGRVPGRGGPRAGRAVRRVRVHRVRERARGGRPRVPEPGLRAVQRRAGGAGPAVHAAGAAGRGHQRGDAVRVRRAAQAGPVRAGRAVRRAARPVRQPAARRHRAGRVLDVRGGARGRVRRAVRGQRHRVRVRVQDAAAVPAAGRRGGRGPAGRVHRVRGRAGARARAVRVRRVARVRGRRVLRGVGRRAARAPRHVRGGGARRAAQPARQEPGQPVREPAARLRRVPGRRARRRARRPPAAVPARRARHPLRVPVRVRVDVRHVGRRVVRAPLVREEAARGRRPPDRPVRRVLGVRVARPGRVHRARRHAPGVRRARAAGPAARLPARLLVRQPARAGRAVRAARRRRHTRQLRVVRRRRAAGGHVPRPLPAPLAVRHRGQPVPRQPARLRAPVAHDGPGLGVRAGGRGHRQRRGAHRQHRAQRAPRAVHIPRVRLRLGRRALRVRPPARRRRQHRHRSHRHHVVRRFRRARRRRHGQRHRRRGRRLVVPVNGRRGVSIFFFYFFFL